MKATYELNDRPSYQNKVLGLQGIYSIDPPVLIYTIKCTDKNTGNSDSYMQIDYIPQNGQDVITSIDFDGGPKLSIGSIIEDAKVTGFLHEDFENVRVLLEPVTPFKIIKEPVK